jgi:hypothetical protein
MKKLSCGLVVAVLGCSCLLCWAMLRLMAEVKNAPRALPFFTSLCITLRPLLIVLPLGALAYYLWLWLRKEERASRWSGLVAAAMTVLIIFVLPAMATSYLLMIDPVKVAVGVR